MSKHKKTRNQKLITDLKRKLQLKNTSVAIPRSESQPTKRNDEGFEFQATDIKIKKSYLTISKETGYINVSSYLMHDLKKTAFLTSSIILVQVFLFTLLKNHIIALPMLGF